MKNLLMLFLMTASMLVAQPRWNDDNDNVPMTSRGMGMLMERLKLTDEQQQLFEQLQVDFQKNQIALRSKLQTARVDLGALFRDEKPDKGMIESKIGELGKIQTDMKISRVGFWFNVNKILGPDQQKVWKHHLRMMQKERMKRGRSMNMRRPQWSPGGWRHHDDD